MRKIISLLLALCMVSSFILPAFATEKEKPFDLSHYTYEEVANMSADEYRQLLSDFEKAYYTSSEDSEPSITPRWSSGNMEKDENGEYVVTEIGSHEMISAQAFTIMGDDMGNLGTSHDPYALTALLSISSSAMKPDRDKKENGIDTQSPYVGHFYSAVDGTNYDGDTNNTALTNCISHYNKAVAAARAAKDLEDTDHMYIAYDEIGRALHYLQDAGEPHHAANKKAIPNLSHSAFESFVDKNIDTYTGSCSTAIGHRQGYTYSDSRSKGVDHFVKGIAKLAYNDIGRVDSIFNTSEWDATAQVTISRSVNFSAVLLYKFFNDSGIPLNKW